MADSVVQQLKRLDEQRSKLLETAKASALAKAKEAVEELNALGYKYRLAEGTVTRATGTRRSGIRDSVLQAVAKAGEAGIAPAKIREAIGATDKAGVQSVANALSALKKAKKVTEQGGNYMTSK